MLHISFEPAPVSFDWNARESPSSSAQWVGGNIATPHIRVSVVQDAVTKRDGHRHVNFTRAQAQALSHLATAVSIAPIPACSFHSG